MTAGQFNIISFTHHHSDCHPGVNRGKILIQQISHVSGGKTGIWLWRLTPIYWLTPQSDNQVLTMVSPESFPQCAGSLRCLLEKWQEVNSDLCACGEP